MGWFGRRKKPAEQARVEPRIEASSTWQLADVEAWNGILPGGLGSSVSPQAAMRHAAVYRCVSVIAFAAAMLPMKSYLEDAAGDRSPSNRHAAADLLRLRPNARMSRTMFWRHMIAQMLLRGNGVAWIERRNSGDPIALWPIPWERVGNELVGDRLVYRLTLDDGRQIRVDQDDVLHFPGSPEWDGRQAKTPIAAMASAVGIGIEADRFAKKYFENDATPSGYISYPVGTGATKVAEQKDELRRVWKERFGGNNRHSGPAVLTDGGEYKPIAITAEDAQLLETRRFQIEDIARIFGVPRFLLGMDETSWGTGIEALGIGFVTYTLDPHLVAIEDEVNFKLYGRGRGRAPGPAPALYLGEFDRDVLVRGDIVSRYKAFQIALGGNNGPGFMTPNEIRKRQNLPKDPAPSSDQLHKGPVKPAPKEPADTPPGGEPGND